MHSLFHEHQRLMIILPALLTHGDSLGDVACEDLETSICEPLHDLKNMISIRLDKMPGHIESNHLIKEYL